MSKEARSPSPAQEKSKDCLSNAADDAINVHKFSDLGKGDRPSKSTSDTQLLFPKSQSGSSYQKSKLRAASSTSSLVMDCRVVLERVSVPSAGAAKPHVHKPCLSEPHTTSQHNSKDANHLKSLQLKQPICWPTAADKEYWEDFEKTVLSSLPSFGELSTRLQKLEDTIYNVGSSTFGVKSRPNVKKTGVPKSTRTCIKLVEDKNQLLQQLQDCSSQERTGLTSLLMQTREKLRKVRLSELASRGERLRLHQGPLRETLTKREKTSYTLSLQPPCQSLNVTLSLIRDQSCLILLKITLWSR